MAKWFGLDETPATPRERRWWIVLAAGTLSGTLAIPWLGILKATIVTIIVTSVVGMAMLGYEHYLNEPE